MVIVVSLVHRLHTYEYEIMGVIAGGGWKYGYEYSYIIVTVSTLPPVYVLQCLTISA